MPQRHLLLRSLLFVPGNRQNMLNRAIGSPADALVPDMEDSVPEAEKEVARRTIAAFLPQLAAAGPAVIPRVNALDTPWAEDDLAAVVGPAIVGVSIGKVASASDIVALDRLLGALERRAGVSEGSTAVVPWIETAAAFMAVRDILSASPRIVAAAFGAEDFTNDLGIERGDDPAPLQWPRATLAVAARAAGVLALDTPYFTLRDEAGLRDEALAVKRLGFKGKFAIHPEQVGVLTAAFSASSRELAEAERIVAAFEQAEKNGRASTSLDGRVIDVPVYRRARALLRSHDTDRSGE